MSPLAASKRQLGIENLSQGDSIRGAMETEGGMTVVRDESLPRVVAKALLAKAIAAAGKKFTREWSVETNVSWDYWWILPQPFGHHEYTNQKVTQCNWYLSIC